MFLAESSGLRPRAQDTACCSPWVFKADVPQRRGMDMPRPYLYLHRTIYSKKLAKQNKVSNHKCFTLKTSINPTHPTNWTLSHPKALGLPKTLNCNSPSCLFWFLSVRVKGFCSYGISFFQRHFSCCLRSSQTRNPLRLTSVVGFCLIAQGDFLKSGASLAENESAAVVWKSC